MNNQTDLTIVSEDSASDYELSSICETEDTVYWTLNVEELGKLFYNVKLTVDKNDK